MKSRVGVYICHCGINIAATVDVEAVAAFAQTLPNVVVAKDYTYMCSDPGQELIKSDIREYGLTHVVVAACSPSMHEPTFRGVVEEEGLNPYCFEMANVREQCSWVHGEREWATEKAKQLVASAVAKASLLQPLEEREVGVTPAALIIGGGIAGIEAALDIANAGFKVYLVEKEPTIGGRVAQLNRTYPTLESCLELLSPRMRAVAEHPNVVLLTSSEVVDIEGYIGNFQVKVRQRPREETIEFDVGSIVVAIGYDHFDARIKPELGYGQYPSVITAPEFERLSSASGPTAGKITLNGKEPKNVVFIQCVGSRDATVGNEYCSRVCCMYTAKQAHLVREKLPKANATVFYMDVRTFGKGFEEFYDRVRREGVRYRRGSVSEIYKRGDRVVVRAEDTLLGEPLEMEADLVVLATGIVPRRDAQGIAELLKLPRSPDGFFAEAHPKLKPVDTVNDGIYLAGCCQGPKDIPDTISQAKAAASSAMIPLSRGRVKVESVTGVVEVETCAGCGICESLCAYGALARDVRKGIMAVNQVLCKGCGACAAACPSGTMTLSHFTHDQIMAQIEAMLE
ncbi:MAG: CoB--CoM heterodisulfide reductase iron-sulfur subunit A family protein [Anaerolineae bacterium]